MTKQNNNSYSTADKKLYDKAMEKKDANVDEAKAGAEREARTIAFIQKHSTLPMVAFSQGFAAGESGKVPGLPTDKGIEPALSDIRLERVHQNHPAHVHIEVTGTGAPMTTKSAIYIKAEKLRQQERSGDDKLFMCIYDNFRDSGQAARAKAVMLRIPHDDLHEGGKLDITGDARTLQKRYPMDGSGPGGVVAQYVKGQLMVCLPPSTSYVQTKEQFIGHIETALNRTFFDKLSLEKQQADREFHAKIQANSEKLEKMNEGYLKERLAITLKGGRVASLEQETKAKLKKLGSMNAPEIVSEYRNAVNAAKSRGQGMER